MTADSFKMPSAGSILDGYKLLSEIASGSCGTVFQAENIISGEIVALKIFPEQGDLAERELQAVRLFRKIEHPNLIRVHHVGKNGPMLFYTMDWCESSLEQRKVTPDELLVFARKLTGALAELHQHGLIHRDIKPANLLFRNGEIVLGDIGLITRQENATFAGSPGFMVPGQSTPDGYSDCYALAKSLYCALSHQAPDRFPYYDGTLSPTASLLMSAILAVCADKPEIRTADNLLNFLNEPAANRNKKRGYFSRLLVACLALILLAGAGTFLLMKMKTPKSTKITGTASIPQEAQPSQPKPQPQKQTPPRDLPKRKPEKEIKESGEILALRGWNEQNRQLIPQLVSPVQRCEMEFEIEFNNRKIDLLQRSHRREISDHEFFLENCRLASLWHTVKQLLRSGIDAEKLDLDYGKLKTKLEIKDPELFRQWQLADRKWQVHKLDCVKELLRRTRETGRDAADILREMAEKDAAVRFFGIEQEKYLGKYDKVRFSGRQNAKQECDEAIAKYLRCRNAFLQAMNKE